METISLTFSASHRLKTPAEFRAVYDRKRSASDAILVVYALPNSLPHPRVGLSVSKKIGNAAARNRCKRLLREAFRLSQHELPSGVDFIVIPRTVDREPSIDELRSALVRLTRDAARRLAKENG